MDEDFVKLVEGSLYQVIATGNSITIIVPGSSETQVLENRGKIVKTAEAYEDRISVEVTKEHGVHVVVLHPRRG